MKLLNFFRKFSKPVVLGGIFTVTTLSLSGCGGERQNDELLLTDSTLSTAVRQIVDYSVIPAVEGFETSVDTFSQYAEGFCASPDAAGLTQLQQQWTDVAASWYRLLPFLFGPLNDSLIVPDYLYVDSLRQRGNDYTETVRSEISSMVNGTDELTSAVFASLNFQKTGLLVLELLVYEDASRSTDSTNVLAGYVSKPRRCEVLSGHAERLALIADNANNEWQLDYQGTAESYRERFLRGDTDDGSAPLTVILTKVQDHLNYLKQRDVAVQAAAISHSPWTLMAATSDSVEAVIYGTAESSVSLADLLIAAGEDASLATVDAHLGQFKEAISDQSTTDFYAASALLDGNFKREIPDGLAVTLGINFTDGD